MARCSFYRGGLPLQRLALPQCCASQQQLRTVSVNTKRKAANHEPTPSQILRFALTGTTKPLGQDVSNSDLDEHLKEIFLGEWPLNALPPPLWSSLHPKTARVDKEVFPKRLKHDVRNLRHLQILIERHVNGNEACALLQANHCWFLAQALERCHRQHSAGEILAAINAIVSRLEKLHAPVSRDLFALGLHYACLSYSTTALKRHVQGYLSVSYKRLDLESSLALIDALDASLLSFELKGDYPDTDIMLRQVAGESNDGLAPRFTLHAALYWAEPHRSTTSIDRYFSLLVKLRSTKSVQDIWSRVLRRLSIESTERDFQTAYNCVLALVKNGDSATASKYLRQISTNADGTLPHISKHKYLGAFLANRQVCGLLRQLSGEKEYIQVLKFQLEHMERRLGIAWQPGRSLHTSVSDSSCIATGQPLLTMDGDSVGYESSERLIAEIRALGCSKSMADFEIIADALDEHGGAQIPVVLSSTERTPLEFAWVPQRCPIEFSNSFEERTDRSVPSPPSTLGLLRLSPDNAGLSSADTRSLHLMQLGSLVMRQNAPRDMHSPKALEWKESGYIVALNRASGQLLAVFIGKAQRPFNQGIQSHIPPPPPGLNAIMAIELHGDLDEIQHWSYRPLLGIDATKCSFDVDPCPDLVT